MRRSQVVRRWAGVRREGEEGARLGSVTIEGEGLRRSGSEFPSLAIMVTKSYTIMRVFEGR
jgi:hypothetical protein